MKRKHIWKCIVTMCLLFLISGCGIMATSDENEGKTEPDLGNIYSEAESVDEQLKCEETKRAETSLISGQFQTHSYTGHFVFTHKQDENVWPEAQLIRTKEELIAYCNEYKDNFDFEQEMNRGDSAGIVPSFYSTISAYDEKWFEDNQLILMPFLAPTSGCNYKVANVDYSSDTASSGELNIDILCQFWMQGDEMCYGMYMILELKDTVLPNDTEITVETNFQYPSPLNVQADCIRISSFTDQKSKVLANSRAELDAFFARSLSDENRQLISKYNDAWFKNHILILAVETISSSERCQVGEVWAVQDEIIVGLRCIHEGWETLSEAEKKEFIAKGEHLTYTADEITVCVLIEVERSEYTDGKESEDVVIETQSIPQF